MSDNKTAEKMIDIILPADQLEGTSATLSRWLVEIGETVKEGDPIAELETDKVAMEICAPKNGVVHEFIASIGEVVQTDVVLGRISPSENMLYTENATQNSMPKTKAEDSNLSNDKSDESKHLKETNSSNSNSNESARDCLSPAVRRLLKENELSIDPIVGSGKRGRVTRDDVLAYLKNPQPKLTRNDASKRSPYSIDHERTSRPLQGDMQPHSTMRKTIAKHMVESLLHTSPHVTSVFEMNMSNIIEHRKWHKKEFEEAGVKLTFTAYFLAAMAKAAQAVPNTNARFHDDALEVFSDINIGVGTALGDAGLVVPVVEQVQSMNLFEIAGALTQQTEKARAGKLKPSDMKNGTITISNHGVSGSLFAAPIIINQPQVAILGIGKLEKRVVVHEVNGVDTMVIQPMCYVSLSIDHRALDAHQTNLFLAHFVEVIESWGQ